MAEDKTIDFDCEFYLQRVVDEGQLDQDRRSTNSVIYHLCTFYGEHPERRCDLKDCPKEKDKDT
jgi:hypothetical protein